MQECSRMTYYETVGETSNASLRRKNEKRDKKCPMSRPGPNFLLFAGLVVASLILLLLPVTAFSQAARIFIDGDFSDWQNLIPIYTDPIGDQVSGDIDFGQLWIANDERFLFLRIEVGAEINLQNDNDLILFLDTDNNPTTGTQIHGIGAELEWNFGDRTGIFVSGVDSFSISHRHIDLVTAPTVTSTQFEIAIDRYVEPVYPIPLFPEDTLKIMFADLTGGDLLPDSGISITYTFDDTSLPPLPSITLRRYDTDHLRLLTYNVSFSGLFDPSRVQCFDRILNAIKPDIIGFQEIYGYSAEETASLIESMLPSTGQQQWYSSRVDPDIITISRYLICSTYPIDGNGAFLIDLRPMYDTDLLLIVAHLPCCENNTERQLEIDAIMAFMRDAKAPGGILDLEPGTPIIIMGDMNLVGYRQQLETLLTGEIVNVDIYGQPFTPDWDGTDLADLSPRQTDLPMTYTWYRDNSSFWPGRLDFIIYTDSVIIPGNHFILFTPEMSADSLASYGLQPQDVIMASDHLPVASDFILPVSNDIQFTFLPVTFSLEQNYPNPFTLNTNIEFGLPRESYVNIVIYNLSGQRVITLVSEQKKADYYDIMWDGMNDKGMKMSPGIYFYRLETEDFCSTKKMILIR